MLKLISGLVLGGSFAAAFPALAQTCAVPEGRWPFGPTWGVAASGSYAYFGRGSTFVVADISDPSNPVVLGQLVLPSQVNQRIVLAGGLAYVADSGGGVRIIDVSNPAAPAEVGAFTASAGANGVAVSGGLAYVADNLDGLRIADVSNPSSPAQVGVADTPGEALGVAVSGNHAYVADGSFGLEVIDVSDPAHPAIVGAYDTSSDDSDYGESVALVGSILYFADGPAGLLVFDVSIPASPALIVSFPSSSWAEAVTIAGSHLYLADGAAGLRLFDISTPSSPIEIGIADTPGYAIDVAVSGTTAIVADESSGLRLVDVASPASPILRGSLDAEGSTEGIALAGSHAYVANGEGGLRILDVSTPSDPVEVGSIDPPGHAAGVAVAAGRAYLAENFDFLGNPFNGLRILDASNPAAPIELGAVALPGIVRGVAVSGPLAYVAAHSQGLRVIDVSDPASPVEVGFYDTPGRALGVAVSGRYAFVADRQAGLRIIDVSVPASPVEVGFLDTDGTADAVAVSGNHAYVADGLSGLRVIDVSNPSSPVEVGAYVPSEGFARGVAVSGSFVVLVAGGLRVIDVSNPAAPAEIASYSPNRGNADVAIAGGLAFFSQFGSGFEIVDVLGCCSSPPGSFVLIDPADGAGALPCAPALDWSDSAGALDYDVDLDTVDPPVVRVASGLPVSTFRPPLPLSPGTLYHWSVTAKNGCGTMTTTSRSFTTGPAEGPFSLLAPANGAVDEPTILTLDWSDSTGAASYALELGTSPAPPLYATGIASSTLEVSGLSPSTTYYWRVSVENSCSGATTPVFSFTTGCLELEGRFPSLPIGRSLSVAARGGHVYYGRGAVFTIADISDPVNPVTVAELVLPAEVSQQLILAGDYAYVPAGPAGLRIIDISDPARPFEAGSYVPAGSVAGLGLAGGYAYVPAGPAGLRVVDVSDPAHPVEVGSLPTLDFDCFGTIGADVAGSLVYMSDGCAGLRIVDVSSPANPTEIGRLPADAAGFNEEAVPVGSYVLVLDGTGVRVVDVATPSAPVEVSFYPTAGYAEAALVAGALAYVPDGSAGLLVFDLSGLPDLTLRGTAPTTGYAIDVGLSASYAYVATLESGLQIIDVSNPSDPISVGYRDTLDSFFDVAVAGNYAFVAGVGDGLRVLDVSAPSTPREVAVLDTPSGARAVALSGAYAYLADDNALRGTISSLRVFDVANPASPSEVGSADLPGNASGVAVSGTRAFVTDRAAQRLRILDVSNPAAPAQIGSVRLAGRPQGIAVSGNLAYVAARGAGLRIVDVTDPAFPVEVGSLDTPGIAVALALAGRYVYLADADAGLRIIDVSDPAAPVEAGFLDTPGSATGVALAGGFALVADGNGLRQIDISDPAHPAEIRFHASRGPTIRLAASGSRAFVSESFGGIEIIDVGACCGGAPGGFSLASPANGAANQSCRPKLAWNNAPEALSYDVYLDMASPPATRIASGVPLATVEAPPLATGTTYYWSVVANNGCGSTSSGVFSFTTGAPAAASLVSPDNGATAQNTTLTLDWSDAGGADGYDLYLGTFSPPPLYRSGIPLSRATVTGLAPLTRYYWYVKTANGCTVTSSAKRLFTTGAPTIEYLSSGVADTCAARAAGSGNGLAEPGEEVAITVTLGNAGTADATGVVAILSTTTPGVSVTTDTASFPFLSPYGGAAPSLSPFVVAVDLAVGCLSSIDLHLAVSSNEGSSGFDFQIPVGRPSGSILDESFEAWPPPGWGIVNNSGGGCPWESTATTGRPNYAGPAGAAADADSDWCGPDATMDTELRTPLLDLSGASAATLGFTASYFDGIPGGADLFEVDLSTDGGASWANLLHWDEDHSPFGPGEPVSLDLAPALGSAEVVVRFRYLSSGWYWWAELDDVRVTITPLCYRCCAAADAFSALSPPDGSVNQPADSVLLDWQDSPGASSYDLYFGTSSPPPLFRANLTTSQEAVSGLAGGTDHYWMVEARASCGTRAASGGEWTFMTTSDPLEVPPDSVRVGKAGADITVGWARVCGVAFDYVIHEGNLDVLASNGTYSHVSKICGDAGGDFMETFAPGPGNHYYLVVGRTASGVEGGYGFGRPQGADAAGCGITGYRPGTCP